MLAAAVLSAAASTINCFSPSRNACKIRNGAKYHHDPYCGAVISSPYKIDTPYSKAAREQKRIQEEQAYAAALQQAEEQALAQYYASASASAAASHEDVIAGASFDPNSSAATVISMASAPSSVSTVGPSPSERFVIVQFKHETCMYRAPFRVAIGDIVAVEADRGENIGTVTEIVTEAPTYDVPNRVSRRATPDDIASLANLRRQETQVTSDVQKAAESVGLGIRVVDTEFQTDMNKLTVYFSSRAPVDFRKLQRTLFREFRCRIWLVNWSEVEFRKRQADRCLGISICSKLGSRLSSVKGGNNHAARRQQ